MLVVVHDRLIEAANQFVLDEKAIGRTDVLQMDASEGRRDTHDRLDELVRVFRVDEDRRCAEAHELVVDDGFALNHGQTGHGADVAEAQHARAVRKDAHAVSNRRVLAG